jgi:integrase
VKNAADSPARDALTTSIYLGGQRPTQVLRVTARQVDLTAVTITLLDPKGRNRHARPRRHLLPIHEDLLPVIRHRVEQAEGPVPLRQETAAALFEEIEAVMRTEGEIERGAAFTMRDLIRTAETQMAALGISSDVCAQIQSHGLGGIQATPLRPP